MRRCPACQSELLPDSKFCHACGAPVANFGALPRNGAYHVMGDPAARPARHVRLTVTSSPADAPPRVIDFTAAGRG